MAQFKTTILISLLLLLTPPVALAYYDVMDTGDILPKEERSLLTHAQLFLDSNLQANITASYDWPLTDSTQLRTSVGLGKIFNLGVAYKWMPVPDYEKQPAMGVIFSGHFAQVSSNSEFAFTAAGMFSKRYELEKLGNHNLYISPKLSLQFLDGQTNVPIGVAGGTSFKLKQFKNARIVSELGLNLKDSINYISVGFAVDFDEFEGITLQKR